jgi:hypothetical protein
MEARLKVRAEHRRISAAEYVRALIERDFKMGESGDILAAPNTEATLVILMMLRALLEGEWGKDEAQRFETWASDRAEDLVRQTLREATE